MDRKAGWMLIGLVVGWAGSAQGQPAFQIFGGGKPAAEFRSAAASGGSINNQGDVISAKVTHSQAANSIAVVGVSQPHPDYGVGGSFWGGRRGVESFAFSDGPGDRYGVWGEGSGGYSRNYGVYGKSTGLWNEQEVYGVYGEATAPNAADRNAFGVYGKASCIFDPPQCRRAAVYADGNLVYTGFLLGPGDFSFQQSLAPLDQALPKLLQLEVVSYEHLQTEEFAHMNLPEGRQVGFVAQQVAEVLPDLVTEAVHPGARDPLDRTLGAEPIRYQALKTIDLIPYLVRAVQEQQAQIEALKAQLLPLQNRLAELEPDAGAGKTEVPAAF